MLMRFAEGQGAIKVIMDLACILGWGNAPVPKSFRIRWPSGEVEGVGDCRTGQYNRIQQGR